MNEIYPKKFNSYLTGENDHTGFEKESFDVVYGNKHFITRILWNKEIQFFDKNCRY
jgi:hypothetical protein